MGPVEYAILRELDESADLTHCPRCDSQLAYDHRGDRIHASTGREECSLSTEASEAVTP